MTIYLGMILFLLATTGGCKIKNKEQARLKQRLARPKMAPIETALESYRLHCGRYPTSFNELLQQPAKLEGKWDGPYLLKKQLLDPWGNKYIYVPEGKVNPGSFDLICYGADGSPGGEGYDKDIYND